MNAFEIRDFIADCYIPLLSVALLINLRYLRATQHIAKFKAGLCLTLLSIVSVYAVMYIDLKFHIWSSIRLDYSTHTALSMALIFILLQNGSRYRTALITSFILYLALMRYQHYHSIMDMVSTIAVIGSLLFFAALVRRSVKSSRVV